MKIGSGDAVSAAFYRARSEWRSLKKELKELEVIFDVAWQQFYKSFLEKINNLNIENPFLEKVEEKENKDNGIFEEDALKNLYRCVVKETHPDKAGQESIEVFRNISKAKKNGDFNEFLEEAKKVSKSKIDVSYVMLDKINEEIDCLKNKINQISKSFCMEWYYAPNSKKPKIMGEIINYYDKKNKK